MDSLDCIRCVPRSFKLQSGIISDDDPADIKLAKDSEKAARKELKKSGLNFGMFTPYYEDECRQSKERHISLQEYLREKQKWAERKKHV